MEHGAAIQVARVDFVRVPVTEMGPALDFYERVLGLRRSPNSPAENWVELEAGNVTLAVMTPHTHGYEFTPLPDGAIAFRVGGVTQAKARLDAEGVTCGEVWDSGACQGVSVTDPAGNRITLHRRYAPYPDGSSPADQS